MDNKEVLSWIRKAKVEKWEGLNFSRNRIATLPPEIGELENLTMLDVSHTGLIEIPREIGRLKKLRILKMAKNRLTSLPDELCQLTELIALDVSVNKLRLLPADFGSLINLQHLQLEINEIKNLPHEISGLENLTILEVHENFLTSLPSEIRFLKKLQTLSMGNNQLAELPFEIGELAYLEKADFSYNKLTVLPFAILKLEKLKHLDLRHNRLSIPPEILENVREPQKILNYYKNIAGPQPNEGVDTEYGNVEMMERLTTLTAHEKLDVYPGKPINEIKLLFVGQGSVGKTSIVRQILYGIYYPHQTKTEGISISQWRLNDKQAIKDRQDPSIVYNSSSIKLNIWDFGGQEIMHATHQFFLTKRSLYILVLDARLTQEENRVEYWLKIIQSFGGESPVLLVGNKTDQHPLDVDRTGLQKKYPNIIGILETSAATGAGIDALKVEIAKQVDTLPHVRDLLPETWFTVKSDLEELGRDKNFITQDEYLSLCKAHGVTDDTSQRTLIGFLHDLGVVLHFQDDPRLEALGILNPQWVTNGVYKILNSHELFQNRGMLTLSMLNVILNLPEYPNNKRLFIVDIMKKFELCYNIEADNSFLIPDLLPKDEIYTGEWDDALAFQFHYNVLPLSIITRFIVRMNAFIHQNTIWRTGVVLKREGNTALVKADIEDKKICIYVGGKQDTRRELLAMIRGGFDAIHKTIAKIEVTEKVPLPNAPEAAPVDLIFLQQAANEGRESLPVQVGNRITDLIVQEVLGQIEKEGKSSPPQFVVNVQGNVYGSIGAGNTVSFVQQKLEPVYDAIAASSRDATEKEDLIVEVDEIKDEVAKGDRANESFLSRRLRNLKKMAPDIAEVILAILSNPAGGVNLIAQKIAKKIQGEEK